LGLATRVIPVLLYDDHGCVKGKQFSKDRRIGSLIDRVRVIERRDVDELILLDVAATPNNRGPRFDLIKEVCSNLFCPVTVGGGVRTLADIRELLNSGADKVSLGTAALERPEFITEASDKFGAQAVVVSVDVFDCGMVATRCGTGPSGRACAAGWAAECEALGAGELILTSVERDGTQRGLDIATIRAVCSSVSIPVIAAGGCGSYEHMKQALDAGAHAVASGAMFQFCDATPKGAARYLKEHGYNTRI
jgi:cyclase